MSSAMIVLICGGSFEGKSLLAIKIASQFNFSGVISTDAVRNFLRVKEGGKDYLGTSTYLLSPKLLQRQMKEVSIVIRHMISIYVERGEHVVIEGMHFSDDFLEWASQQPFLKICIQNTLPLSDRILYKTLTRSRLSGISPVSSKDRVRPVKDIDVKNTSYMSHSKRIEEIHSDILVRCEKHGFHILEFSDLACCVDEAVGLVDDWIRSKAEEDRP